MCLSPVKIYNNAHFLSVAHSKPFEMFVPCGHCSECRNNKRAAWKLRSYYHAKGMFENNLDSFAVFDTLTYDSDNLPHISDITPYAFSHRFNYSCFKRSDIQNFMKRLRVRLDRAGYDVKDHLDYFLSSEYGDEEEYIYKGKKYKHTRRPHYHVLFFVKFNIDPCVFSRFVSDAWLYGRTDGVAYKGRSYFLNKRVFRSNTPYFLNIVGYVAKYVSKQSSFDRRIKKAVYYIAVERFGNNPDWLSKPEPRKFYKDLLRSCHQFSLVSKDFGAYLLKCVPLDYLVENNSAPMYVTKNRILVNIPLPEYYKRKLFYDLVYYNGSRFWRPNELGRKYLTLLHNKAIKNYSMRCESIYSICDQVLVNSSEIKRSIRDYLAGRSWLDFSKYVMDKRGRIKCMDLNYEDSISFESFQYDNLRQFVKLVYPYNTSLDVQRFGRRVVCDSYAGSSAVSRAFCERFSPSKSIRVVGVYEFENKSYEVVVYCDPPLMRFPVNCVPSEYWAKSNCYYDSSFEPLYGLILAIYDIYNKMRENDLLKIELNKERFQEIGLYPKV